MRAPRWTRRRRPRSFLRRFSERWFRRKASKDTDPLLRLIRSRAMQAKRARDEKINELSLLAVQRWIAGRLVTHERVTLEMFRKRCPHCRAEPLEVSIRQT